MFYFQTLFTRGEIKNIGGKLPRGRGEGSWWSTHHTNRDAMDTGYEQQFKRARGDAAPCGKEKKTGENGNWGSLAPARSDPPSTDGA